MHMTVEALAKMIDHTMLYPYASERDFIKVCDEAKQYGFKSVAVNSYAVFHVKELLEGSDILVDAAVAFPFGQESIPTKVFEVSDVIAQGADEVDYVINVVEVKNGHFGYIEEEMRRITDCCKKGNVVSKVIFENCYLTKDEIAKLCEIACNVKPDFIKTSTGFGTGGATLEEVRLMKSIVGDMVKVKAAGNVRTYQTAMDMIKAGAERIGARVSVEIIEEMKSLNKKG